MNIKWTRRAAIQLADAAVYLEGERAGSGLSFQEAVFSTVETAADLPRLFPRVPGIEDGEVRRALIRRYSYWIVFEVIEERTLIIILSIWHAQRGKQPPLR